MLVMMLRLYNKCSDLFMRCRLLTGAILAHELMHGWLRLKGYIYYIHFDFYLGVELLSIT